MLQLNKIRSKRPTKVGDYGEYIHDYRDTWFKDYTKTTISEDIMNHKDKVHEDSIPEVLLATYGIKLGFGGLYNKAWIVIAEHKGNLTILYQHDFTYYIYSIPYEVDNKLVDNHDQYSLDTHANESPNYQGG